MSQLGRLFGRLVLTLSPVVACSVINQFDEVVPAPGAGGTGDGPSAGGASGGEVPDIGGTTGSGGDAGGDTSSGGAAPEQTPVRGLLVVAGTDPTDGDANVVSLIEPRTGKELARQTLAGAAVVGLAYDGASGRDAWFEFTGASFPADPTSKAALQVYGFVDGGNTWKPLSTKVVPGLPPPRADTFVVLNDRLTYLSYSIVGGKPVDSLTVLDTTDLNAITALKFAPLDFGLDSEVLGMVGTRGVLGDATAVGGTLAIAVGTGCNGRQALRVCGEIKLLPVTVGDDVSQGVPVSFALSLVGEPAFASAQTGQLGYIAFSPVAGKSVVLRHFDPRNLSKMESGAPAFKSAWLGGLAYAECQDVALFTGVTQGSLYAASPAGLTGEQSLDHPGQSVVYEPYTRRAIALFNPDNSNFADSGFASGAGGAGGSAGDPPASLTAFEVKPSAALTATAPADWTPPTNLAPNLAVARFPVAYPCQ